MVLEFVDDIKAQLVNIDEKLDILGSTVGAIHADVKRLAGKPVLELYAEWAERTLIATGSQLPSEGTCLSFCRATVWSHDLF